MSTLASRSLAACGNLLLATFILFSTAAMGADVVSTFVGGTRMWSDNASWTNTPFLGGYPDNGNAGVDTYDAVVPNGALSLDRNTVIQKFTHSNGTVNGNFDLTVNELHTWRGGTLGGTGRNLDAGGLAITGVVNLIQRQLEPRMAATLAGGRLQMSTGAVLTNPPGVNFSITDDSSVFSGGGSPSIVNLGIVEKTGAGNGVSGAGANISRIDVPLINRNVTRVSAGTLQINGGGLTASSLEAGAGALIQLTADYTLDGATLSGAGTGQVSSATTTLSNVVTASVATFLHSGGVIGGPGTLVTSGQYDWRSGTASGAGTTRTDGPLSINGSVNLIQRRLEPRMSATLAGGRVQMSTGAVLTNSAGMTFSILDDSSIFNGGGSPSIVNLGIVEKTGAGNGVSGAGANISRIDVPLINRNVTRVSAGTLQINGGGLTASSLEAGAGALIQLTADYTLDGATLSGAGTGQVSSATTTLSNVVTASVATFLHSGGVIGGPGTLVTSGQYVWRSGTASGAGTTRTDGPLSINGSVNLIQRRLEPRMAATLAGGRLQMSTGAVLTNSAGMTFSILDDSSVFNGGGSPSIVNLGIVEKTGAGNGVSGAGANISRIDVPLINRNVTRVNAGTLQINGGGLTASSLEAGAGALVQLTADYTLDGATLSGAGTGQVSSATTTLSNVVTASVATFLHSGGVIGGSGTLVTSGQYDWRSGTASGAGTTRTDGPLSINGSVNLIQRRLEPMLSATLAGGRLQMSTGAVLTNPPGATFSILDDSSIFTGGGGPSIVNLGIVAKTGAGNGVSGVGANISRIDVPLSNSGIVSAQSGDLRFTSGYVQTAGSTVLTGGVISASVPLDIQGGSVVGMGMVAANVTNNGTISPGFSADTLHFFGNVTCKGGSKLKIELGGITPGSQHDVINVTNILILAGSLEVSLINGFQSAIPAGATFTVVAAGGSLTGSFSNVASGQRLATSDGFGSFLVTYSGATRTVVLSDFMPEAGCSLICPPNMTVPNAPGQCGATVNFPPPTASGSCGPVVSTPASGSFFPVGTTVVSCTTTGAASCSFTVTVLDNENPAIACPADMVLSTSPGLCSRTNVTYVATVSDNCPGAVLTQTAGLPSGGTFPKGTTTNTFLATDASGNTFTCSFRVTIQDAEAPQVNCPANIVLTTDPGTCSAADVTFTVGATDNCAGVTLVCNPPSGSTFVRGVTSVLCIATDGSGNTNACSFTVTVNDSELPSVTCSSNIAVTVGAGATSALVNFAPPAGDDNCPGATASCVPPSGSVFPLGTTTVTCGAVDTSGNSNSCTFTVTVTAAAENVPPTITCPGNIITNNAQGSCARELTFAALVTGIPTPVVTYTVEGTEIASPFSFPVGTTTVTCTASNVAGVTSCSFTITVEDTEPPSITCPSNVAVIAALGSTSAIVNFTAPMATDNCPGVSASCQPPSGSTFPLGTTVVTCTAVDGAGNSTICNFTVTVSSAALPPSIVCPTSFRTNTAPGLCTRTLSFAAIVSGNPTPTITYMIGAMEIGSPFEFPVGTTTVTCTVSNVAGVASCSFTVVVVDNEPPLLVCPSRIVVAAPLGQLGTMVDFDTSATDNCGNSLVVECVPTPGYFAVGDTPVTCEAVDSNGNPAICSFIVTVNATTDALRACAFTQGFYGNARGKFNGIVSLSLVEQLLDIGRLVVGKAGTRSLAILPGDAELLQMRLPAGGPPAALADNGEQTLQTAVLPLNNKGRFANVFLGQTITLSLNARLNSALLSFPLSQGFCSQVVHAGQDGLKGTPDDLLVAGDIQNFRVPAAVIDALQDPLLGINDLTVGGLLELANRGLAGLPTGPATLSEINEAVDAINRSFDECRAVVDCTPDVITDAFNDMFAERPELDASPSAGARLATRVRSSNLGAQKEPGEPEIDSTSGGKSVWWKWLAHSSGPVTLSTAGSSMDTLLGVFTGTDFANLVPVAHNDDAQGTAQSEVTFQAIAGTEYQILVDGLDGSAGEIVLTLVKGLPEICQPFTVDNSVLRFCLNSEPDRFHVLEGTSDMVNWGLLSSGKSNNGVLVATDAARSNFRVRVYRVSFEP